MSILNISFPYNKLFPNDLIPDHTGLVALGGKLTTFSLVEAYSKGMFPWAGTNPIPWYSPDPRLILLPEDYHVSKSLSKLLSKTRFSVHFDSNFINVITNCSQIKRKNQKGTWIDQNIIEAYNELFKINIAHCIEVFYNNQLYGGLYGISIGKIFFGESMFSLKPNGSKIALYFLIQKCKLLGLQLIDCQQSTPHMISLGAKEISRKEFLQQIEVLLLHGINIQKW